MVKCGDSAGMEILKKPVKQCILTVLQVFKYGAYGIRTHHFQPGKPANKGFLHVVLHFVLHCFKVLVNYAALFFVFSADGVSVYGLHH